MVQPATPIMSELSQLKQITYAHSHLQTQIFLRMKQLYRELAAVQGQFAVQKPAISTPSFSAAKIKLELPPKFTGKPVDLSAWVFQVKQYYGMVGINKTIDMVKLAVSRLEWYAFTWWQQLTNRGVEFELRTLFWQDLKYELVNAFVNIDCKIKIQRKLSALK